MIRRIALSMVALGLAAGITVVLVSAKDDSSSPKPLWVPKTDETAIAAHAPITQSEIEEAIRISSEDSNIAAIRGAETITVESVIRLMSGNIRVGAMVTYKLSKPVNIDLVVPWADSSASDDASKERGYGLAEMRQKVTGLTEFRVTVDLNVKRVVGVVPFRFVDWDESVAKVRPVESNQ